MLKGFGMATAARRRMNKRKTKPVAKSRYVDSLDGLRALCALAVVGYHMKLPWLGGGLLGVTVLFVLSGYLVTAGLIKEFSTSHGRINLGQFWIRRFWRLMPTVAVFVAVTGAVCAIFNAELFTKMRPDILPSLFMVINWTKILSNESYFAAAGAPSPLTHFWSLAIEAQFYFVWPPIIYLLMRLRTPRKGIKAGLLVASLVSAGLMALMYVPGADPSRVYYGTDTRAMSMLLGCWLAFAWSFGRMSRHKASRLKGIHRTVVQLIGPACIMGLVAMMIFTEGYSSFSYYGGILLCSVLTLGAVACLVPAGSVVSRIFSFKPFVWVGKRSYAIYLWHYPLLELMNPLNATAGIPWWKLLLELALILLLSDLSYRFIETPLRSPAAIRGAFDNGEKSGRRERQRTRRQTTNSPAVPSKGILAVAPALALILVGAAITTYGLINVEPVTAGGVRANEKRVMQASLKKPLQDGVYDVVLIGDSVSLGANSQLNEEFPHGLMDTKGSRDPSEALEALKGYIDQGVVGDDVVWSIGTNGILDSDVISKLLKMVGPDRRLWMVNLRTPNSKDVDNNALIAQTVEKNDNVYLIDWLGASKGHDDWFDSDGIHLTWDGRDAYAALVVETMDYQVPTDADTTYNVVILGDTVCLDAADQLATAFPKGLVDTADGRTTQAIASAYEGYKNQDVVGSVVVFAIGSEDTLDAGQVESLISTVGNDKDIWLVNARTPNNWGTQNNKLFEDVAKKHANVTIIDWYAATKGHDDWLAEDGTSLSSTGAQAYADLIAKEVVIPEPTDSEDSSTSKDSSNSSSTSKDSSQSTSTSKDSTDKSSSDKKDASGSAKSTGSGTGGSSSSSSASSSSGSSSSSSSSTAGGSSTGSGGSSSNSSSSSAKKS